MMDRFQSTDDGFTLVEVLVSLTIMAIVLVAVFKLRAQSISVETANRFQTTATLLAQTTLAKVKATPLDALQSDSGAYEGAYTGYRWQLTLTDVAAEELDTIGRRLKRISIDIYLEADRYRHNLTTYHFFQ